MAATGTTTHLVAGGKADELREMSNGLLSVSLQMAQRSGVSAMAEVLMQVFRDELQVSLLESPTPLVYEFQLRGFGIVGNRHLEKLTDGVLFEDPEMVPGESVPVPAVVLNSAYDQSSEPDPQAVTTIFGKITVQRTKRWGYHSVLTLVPLPSSFRLLKR